MLCSHCAGYGLRCHRVVKTICEIIGIKDISVKVEGSIKNTQNLTKAFFSGLLKQVNFDKSEVFSLGTYIS